MVYSKEQFNRGFNGAGSIMGSVLVIIFRISWGQLLKTF